MITQAATRYAKALISLADDQKVLDKVFTDMKLIGATVGENRELLVLLQSPIVKKDKKAAILKSLFGERTCELSHLFVQLLTRNKREAILGDIATEVVRLYKVKNNIVVTELTTAIKSSPEFNSTISKLVAENTGKTVELVENIDSDIIGGFVVKVGDKQFDASISRQIKRLTQEFSENPYIAEL